MNHDELSPFLSMISHYSDDLSIDCFIKNINKKAVTAIVKNEENITENLSSLLSGVTERLDDITYRVKEESNIRLGKSVYHFAGAFYMMDPSSSYVTYQVSKLLPKNPVVYDMCAAPGGKSISLSMRRNDAFIIANDISFQRADEIVKNVNRLGITNILTTSNDPTKVDYEPYFDLCILDAPCSGSGMIRKEEKMLRDYSEDKVQRLLPIQKSLLDKAANLVREGGYLLYSTCSLSVEEDEDQVKAFLNSHREFEYVALEKEEGILDGVDSLGYHLLPGVSRGEGIYYALMRKLDRGSRLNVDPELTEFKYKDNVYVCREIPSPFDRITYLTPGIKKYDTSEYPKCEFDNAYCKVDRKTPVLELSQEEAISYIAGSEIRKNCDAKDGLVILAYDSYRLGYGKKVGNRIKNYLPKGLRTDIEFIG